MFNGSIFSEAVVFYDMFWKLCFFSMQYQTWVN